MQTLPVPHLGLFKVSKNRQLLIRINIHTLSDIYKKSNFTQYFDI
jgi:hypothetical protein